MGVAKDGLCRLPGFEVSEDYRGALFQLVKVSRKPIFMHHVLDQSSALPQPHPCGGD